MKLKIALFGAVAALALTGSAFAGDKKAAGDDGAVERHVVIIGGPGGHDMDPGDMGPGEHDVFIMAGGPGGMHAKLDANGDGVITKAEFMAMHDDMWAKLDKNHDGKLDKDEMGHGPDDHHGPMRFKMRHDGPGEHGPGMMRHGPEEMDSDKDGRISFEEFAAPIKDVFAHLDKDKSGYLEKGEQPDGHHVEVRRIERRESGEKDGDGK